MIPIETNSENLTKSLISVKVNKNLCIDKGLREVSTK